MVKLTEKEIQEQLENDADGELPLIPRKALSAFRFEITESIEDLADIIENLPKKRTPQERVIDRNGDVYFTGGDSVAPWSVIKSFEEDGSTVYALNDPEFDSSAEVWVDKDKSTMIIRTAWSGFSYFIREKENGGCVVTFDGPVNGLLRQNLLPQMTYVPGTLKGKFCDEDGDITPYLDIALYGELRKQKNKIVSDDYMEETDYNPQDDYGHWVNMRFNNEIPFLPQSYFLLYNAQERKNYQANQDYAEGRKEFIGSYKKDIIRKRIEAYKAQVSGVVIADKIAQEVREGKEKRNITPEVGAEIKQRMMEEMQNKR